MLLLDIYFVSTLNYNYNTVSKFFQKNLLSTHNIELISNETNTSNIGIVDFIKILRSSEAMKILGQSFIKAEKSLNKNIKFKHAALKKKEKDLLIQKKTISPQNYTSSIIMFKKEVFKVQNNEKKERAILNRSFQISQKKLKDLLAKIIKSISIKKNINIVLLKENIFIFNDQSIDLTNQALNIFNQKTKNMSIQILRSN